ncbi:MAG TPA: hypothetical protein IAC31_08745 [Candidatus Faecousia intestinigallinarum]|nr:hypothetical protein [Candidatus Faecousia intestinigallinarum]
MSKRVLDCYYKRGFNIRRVSDMNRGGYCTSVSRQGDTPFTTIHLTRSGFYFLAGTPDEELESEREKFARSNKRVYDRTERGFRCLLSNQSRSIVYELYRLATRTPADPDMQEQFRALLAQGVSTWSVTQLANCIHLAPEVSVMPRRMNAAQIASASRLSTVINMFRMNGFLTYMDRRPMDTGWMINGLSTQEQYEKRVEAGDLDIPAFVFQSLRKWYADNPDAYSFFHPDKSLSAHKEEWLTTPAFYAAREIPGYEMITFEEPNVSARGAQNTLRSTFLGIAVGKEKNYIVYHCRRNKMTWNGRIEALTAVAAQRGLDAYAEQSPIPGAGRTVQHAIMFCSKFSHFAALFQDIKQSGRRETSSRFGYPYLSLHIIPVNNSGLVQLRGLMESSPEQYMQQLVKRIAARNSDVFETGNSIFPLGYQGTPVFVAHDMDYHRLAEALIRFRAGQKFYISCYPEQAKYLTSIFPGVQFL